MVTIFLVTWSAGTFDLSPTFQQLAMCIDLARNTKF